MIRRLLGLTYVGVLGRVVPVDPDTCPDLWPPQPFDTVVRYIMAGPSIPVVDRLGRMRRYWGRRGSRRFQRRLNAAIDGILGNVGMYGISALDPRWAMAYVEHDLIDKCFEEARRQEDLEMLAELDRIIAAA